MYTNKKEKRSGTKRKKSAHQLIIGEIIGQNKIIQRKVSRDGVEKQAAR